MRDIAIVMITLDRTPRKNYLGETIANLSRSKTFVSSRFHSFSLIDSGSTNFGSYIHNERVELPMQMYLTDVPRNARENVSCALHVGAKTNAPWVLFVEDDIDVCDDFLDGVGAWLDQHATSDYHVYAFGAAYSQISHAHHLCQTQWLYPVGAFYGTQCFALNHNDAFSLAEWLRTHILVNGVNAPGAYDISMHEWAKTNWPDIDNFLASVPNFVQHCGDQSALDNKFFQFPAWPGREWSYRQVITS